MMFAVRRCEIDFHRPAHLDDLVEVRSRLTALSGARLNAVQEIWRAGNAEGWIADSALARSEEHTSELQSLMRISYAVFCLKKQKQINTYSSTHYSISTNT